jgi:hypothetical protein
MKTLNEGQNKELERLRDWCLTILQHIKKSVPESDRHNPMFIKFAEATNHGFQTGNLRGMKLMAQDLTDWGKQLNKEQADELNQILRKKFGEDLHYDVPYL